MAFEALTLRVVSILHLCGVIAGGAKPYDPSAAGGAEAVIGVVLVGGAVAIVRRRRSGPAMAQAAARFAIVGIVGIVVGPDVHPRSLATGRRHTRQRWFPC